MLPRETSPYRHVTTAYVKPIILLHYSGYFELKAGQDSVPTPKRSAERSLLYAYVHQRLFPAVDIQEKRRMSNYQFRDKRLFLLLGNENIAAVCDTDPHFFQSREYSIPNYKTLLSNWAIYLKNYILTSH